MAQAINADYLKAGSLRNLCAHLLSVLAGLSDDGCRVLALNSATERIEEFLIQFNSPFIAIRLK